MTNDMSCVIIPRSDQQNADDFVSGPRTFTIERVEIRPGTEQPVSIWLNGEDRPWKSCKSMNRCLVILWGPDTKQYIGRSLTLFRDPTAKFAGAEVGGIRISHMSHIDREHTIALTISKGNRKPFKVLPLKMDARPAASATAPDATLVAAGTEAAKQGGVALKAWWESLAKADKPPLAQTLADVLKPLAAAADAAAIAEPGAES